MLQSDEKKSLTAWCRNFLSLLAVCFQDQWCILFKTRKSSSLTQGEKEDLLEVSFDTHPFADCDWPARCRLQQSGLVILEIGQVLGLA